MFIPDRFESTTYSTMQVSEAAIDIMLYLKESTRYLLIFKSSNISIINKSVYLSQKIHLHYHEEYENFTLVCKIILPKIVTQFYVILFYIHT